MRISVLSTLLAIPALLPGQTTLREAAAQRALLFGAAADANEFNQPDRLKMPAYASTLAAQFNMLEAENAMKWNPIHPTQTTYNFGPPDELVAFARQNQMAVRGHNLCWYSNNPAWLTNFAKTASPSGMAAALHDHIQAVVTRYKGQIFAWDVVNEAVNDNGNGMRSSIWYDQPGIGLSGTGYVEQAFRWTHDADPAALLFYNDYGIEGPGAKFNTVYNMVKDFVARGVPIHGVGLQMHLDTGGYPSTTGLAQVMKQITDLGLQVHITEMDVRLPVDSSGNATSAALQNQAQTYQRILTVCLQNPGCTAFQTWGFTDQFSWIPGFMPGFGAALPFDQNYQPKPAVASMISAMQNVAPALAAAGVVNAGSYRGGAVAPGEIVTIYGANFGPAPIVTAQLDSGGRFSSNLAGAQVLFDGVPAPLIYALAGQVSAIVPFGLAARTQTVIQYSYNNVQSNSVTLPVTASAPSIFSADSSGAGQGAILNQDYSRNGAANPAAAGSVVQIFATGGGAIAGGAVDGALAPGAGSQTLPVTAIIGGLDAKVIYAGPAPNLVNGVLQVNLTVPAGVAPGPQPVVITVGGVPTQDGITVAVK